MAATRETSLPGNSRRRWNAAGLWPLRPYLGCGRGFVGSLDVALHFEIHPPCPHLVCPRTLDQGARLRNLHAHLKRVGVMPALGVNALVLVSGVGVHPNHA
eukprot:CAMPEP_0117601668 /NCGR_PEP_ID=MMETSP0784-20121206/77163_1 /TAXON_ID=39447 /ORGANISM="" /LENGTH=100 /DNA_ID=CAMNT_0005404421 /DNA_START=33 /DNA_END=335 /DNA_ORIENTATION=-